MADGAGVERDRHYSQLGCLSPIRVVQEWFDSLDALRRANRAASGGNKNMLEALDQVSASGERVIACLDEHVRLYNRETETVQELSGTFRLGIHRILSLRSEGERLDSYIRQMRLAEEGLDARDVEFKKPAQMPSKQPSPQLSSFSLPGSTPLPRAVSLEDFRKHRDATLDGRKSVDSGSSMRKTKSESDVAIHSMKKKVESLTVDCKRLKLSEKKLLKQSITLNRQCKTLESERDRAEDRLKIEQTQRDSVEKLRQRNKELEEQLRELCKTQVLREREELAREQQKKEEGGDEGVEEGGGEGVEEAGVMADGV